MTEFEEPVKKTLEQLKENVDATLADLEEATKVDLDRIDHAVKMDDAFRTIQKLKTDVESDVLSDREAMQKLIESGALQTLKDDVIRNMNRKV